MRCGVCVSIIFLTTSATAPAESPWQPKAGPLMTRWAKDVTPEKVHPEYPRPQMVRRDWQNLNGLWEYAVRPKDEARPTVFDGQILVPFPIEAALSGVMRRVDETQRVWYRRMFDVPANWADRRLLLHFGAVDWETTVWVNGTEVGTHRGGYDLFTFDITDTLQEAGPQELVVAVWDPTDAGYQPRGKQVRKPGGIWYTPTTGIWQTVWLEPVPAAYIEELTIVPDIDAGVVRVTVQAHGADSAAVVRALVSEGDREVAVAGGTPDRPIELPIAGARVWSPDTPFLYGLRITLSGRAGQARDQVDAYFGMRKIALGRDERGILRLMLNNKPCFMYGPLDQGFWPDGLYTAPTDEALRFDIEMTKRFGMNLARKHVKVEPQRWYYWCDRLGLLVWQDMPSGDAFPKEGKSEIERSPESTAQFELELKRLIATHRNHPSIVLWVPFNEGWGQFDTQRITELVRQCDPTRLVDNASGWNDRKVGDVLDLHEYPGPASPQPETSRAAVLGEFGGLGLPISGHTWQAERNWGYRSFKDAQRLTEAYVNLLDWLRPLTADPGLSAAVYTQTTDVEVEVNGLMTYDRELFKPDVERIAAAARRVLRPPPEIRTVVPTSQAQGLDWRYTLDQPADDWMQPGFAEVGWRSGTGGFGRAGTPGIQARTTWETDDIWLRRCVDLTALPAQPYLKLYHDEDCEVYINGRFVAFVEGYSSSYVFVPLADAKTLQIGANVIAVHCHQTGGGQGIDVGIVDVIEPAVGD